MPPLTQTNRYIADPVERQKVLERNARDSFAFEGVRGLKLPGGQPPAPPRKKAPSKKAAKSS